jgi:hypothetical protein
MTEVDRDEEILDHILFCIYMELTLHLFSTQTEFLAFLTRFQSLHTVSFFVEYAS